MIISHQLVAVSYTHLDVYKRQDYMNTEFNEEKEIELINSIIREAIVHGSDEGGAYEINERCV